MKRSSMDPRPVMKLRWTVSESHDRCTVFVGISGQTLVNCGELTFRHGEESERFRSTLKMGIMSPGFEGITESGWRLTLKGN